MKEPQSYSVERDLADSPAARRAATMEHREQPPPAGHYRAGKGHLAITAKRGKSFHLCSSLHPDYICCKVHVLQALSNCPYDCSYCFLQNYLTDTTTRVVGDTAALLAEIETKTKQEPGRFLRVGTWELGDSLALEPLTGTAAELVRAFAHMPYAILELKTKSNLVDGLLELPHAGRTVVSWTLNPQAVIRTEELHTASLEQRLEAMGRVVEAGYPVAVHFDPMILHRGWEENYTDLVRRLFEAVPANRVAWISMGSLRFNPEMKKIMEDNFPGSRITSAEMVLGDDGKVRYIKPLRLAMYHRLYRAIRDYGGDEICVYLCMERWDIWQRIFGERPESTAHLDFLITESLFNRFPGMVHLRPERRFYDPPGP
ncbi:MAG: hypothetical protein GY731_17655 [Gammaproteobacteria bacterium]|nr:hypothetical protein [Gammaproteobacteria bacterium]